MQKSSSIFLHLARKNVLASSSVRPYTKAAVPQVIKEVAEEDTESFTNTSQQRYVYKQKSVKIRAKQVSGRHIPERPGGKPLLDPAHPKNSTMGIANGTYQVNKAKLSDKDLKDRIDYEVAQARGGYKDFSAVGNPRDLISAPIMESIEPFTRRIKPAPSEAQRILKTSEEWFGYDKASPRPVDAEYMDNAKKWREGEYISQKDYVEQFTRGNTSLPIFAREKKPDPFRGQMHLIKRVSYKNLDFLLNFITPGGKIMNRRVTGVSGKAQRRIKREVKKARFLGLIPFTANPASSLAVDEATEKNLQDFHGGASTGPDRRSLLTTSEHIVEQSDSLDNLYDYIGSLRKNINPDPHIDWAAARNTSNPAPKEQLIDMEILGLLPHQMAQKKQKLKQLLLENIVLDRFKTLAASHPVQQLEAATTPSPAASQPAQK